MESQVCGNMTLEGNYNRDDQIAEILTLQAESLRCYLLETSARLVLALSGLAGLSLSSMGTRRTAERCPTCRVSLGSGRRTRLLPSSCMPL